MSERLDFEIVSRNLVKGRENAKNLIKDGKVSVNGKICTKPAFQVCENDRIEICGDTLRFAGRGGLKLEKALDVFPIDLSGRICMDIGASTGGFTDCMLQSGAEFVYAVDVGHGQLADFLAGDSRVINMEGVDIRNLKSADLPKIPSFISCDVSFISLKLVLPEIYRLLSESGECVCLVKPQFEAGRENIGKNGVVKSQKVHIKVLESVIQQADTIGFAVKGVCPSAIKGAKGGNIEYLMYISKGGSEKSQVIDIRTLVEDAFKSF